MENIYGTLKYKLLPQIYPLIFKELPNKQKFKGYNYYEINQSSDKVLVWFKQGSMCLENGLYTESAFLKELADELDITIYAFDYPVAPQAKYPKIPKLCYDFYRYICDKCSDKRIYLGGAPAGGNLALGVTMKLLENNLTPAPLLLYYPNTSYLSISDKEWNNSSLMLNFIDYAYARNMYLKDGKKFDMRSPLCSPVLYNKFDHINFPKCYIIICKKDMLIEQQEYIIDQISNITVDKVDHPHGFIINLDQAKKTINNSMKQFIV